MALASYPSGEGFDWNPDIVVEDLLFDPLTRVFETLPHRRACPRIEDDDWLRLGVLRVLHPTESGRGFLQEHATDQRTPPRPAIISSL